MSSYKCKYCKGEYIGDDPNYRLCGKCVDFLRSRKNNRECEECGHIIHEKHFEENTNRCKRCFEKERRTNQKLEKITCEFCNVTAMQRKIVAGICEHCVGVMKNRVSRNLDKVICPECDKPKSLIDFCQGQQECRECRLEKIFNDIFLDHGIVYEGFRCKGILPISPIVARFGDIKRSPSGEYKLFG